MSMTDPRLDALAGAIADDTPVDWSAEESGASAESVATVRELRSLALTAAVSRRGAGPERPASLFRWGHLEVLERLGEGSYGEVFRAWDPALGREVALKLRHPAMAKGESARTWLAEAQRMARTARGG